MNIEKHNCLTADIAVIPNYQPDPMNRQIDFYYADHGKLIIVGLADNNYIYWLSVTKLNDTETNRAIFDHISQLEPAILGHEYIALKKTNYTYEKLREFYHDSLRLAQAQVKWEEHLLWLTPFGGNYSSDQTKHHGKIFARDICNNYNKLKTLCKFREAGGSYINVMRYYLSIISERSNDPCTDYSQKLELINLIQSEKYLLCSDNSAVRELYIKLEQCCSDIYNAYMSVVR